MPRRSLHPPPTPADALVERVGCCACSAAPPCCGLCGPGLLALLRKQGHVAGLAYAACGRASVRGKGIRWTSGAIGWRGSVRTNATTSTLCRLLPIYV